MFSQLNFSGGPLLQVSGTNLVLPLKNDINSTPFISPYPFFPLGLPQTITTPNNVPATNAQTPTATVTVTSQGIPRPEGTVALLLLKMVNFVKDSFMQSLIIVFVKRIKFACL